MLIETMLEIAGGVVAVGIAAYFALRRRKPAETAAKPSEPTFEEALKTAEKPLSEKLGAQRSALFKGLSKFFDRGGGGVSDEGWQEIEEILLEGDVGMQTTTEIIHRVRQRIASGSTDSVQGLFKTASESLFEGLSHGAPDIDSAPKPWVISIVGVNGVGKTTTVGKLAAYFSGQGRSVLLAAVDTFRAGAIAQLKVWAERTTSQFVTGREGADPGAVAFDSVTAGKARGVDVVLLDTAGRLHTKDNLMDELKKVHRVVKKVIPEAPHECWLVLDGTAGQNAVRQAQEFHQALGLTGIIVTKLDGTAKGGAVFSIANDLKLPIRFIGVGESQEDLISFSPKPYVEALLGANS